MNLVETTTVAAAALPLERLRQHLRLGTGFSDDSLQDTALEASLRAALARVEGHCSKAVLARGFCLTVTEWRDLSRLVLPVSPVAAVTRLSIFDRAGTETEVPAMQYRLIRDDHRPMLISAGYALPRIPLAGRAEVAFEAGHDGFDAVPGDMAQAVLMLAAHIYEGRAGEGAPLPGVVAGLLERYRPLRLGAGWSA
ncbi:head-tail connector protein [Oceaniglobus roseus]|uniref:head-tail connector protein n=1 Tax=Oceaniglobus roseus TaxID=1737570 RepID=UPI000C7F0423|nr:hypothetical protein [Kandeliimicrobium roseum]